MRIIDIIKELSRIYKTYGNVEVFRYDSELDEPTIENISIIDNDNVKGFGALLW